MAGKENPVEATTIVQNFVRMRDLKGLRMKLFNPKED
jgi:hypothetical protein